MCFGGGNSGSSTPPPANPGRIDVSKPAPDPTQAYKYKGQDVGDNTSGRYGGGLLVDAQAKAGKPALGA